MRERGMIWLMLDKGRPVGEITRFLHLMLSASFFFRVLLGLSGALGLVLTGCMTPGLSSSSAGGDLPALMVERLGWMDEVAQVKQARSLPVTDARREAELLDAMERLGAESGLPAARVRTFFSGQISAAKQCQEEWLRRHAGVKPSNQAVPDLGTTVRPALDALGRKMIRALAAARASQDTAPLIRAARTQLAQAGYSQDVITPAVRGLEDALSSPGSGLP
jgi:chorismate mutase-like protein